MGKLTLLLVLAAVLGGSLITFNSQVLSTETMREQGEVQYDILAREVASSGQSVIVNAMFGEEGFEPRLRFSEGDVSGGRFTVDTYDAPANGAGDRHEVTFTVTGHSGGATHTVSSRYSWDPMDFPGPLWLDVPFATAHLDEHAVVDGGEEALEAYFDPRLFNDLRLNTFLHFNQDVLNPLASALSGTRGRGGDLLARDLDAFGLLEDVNVTDARELYQAAVGAHVPGSDPTLAGPITVSNTRRFAGNKIVRVSGDLTIDSSGRIEGDGALVVEGALHVEDGGRLDWDGLVIVHSEAQLLPVELEGHVQIDGALVVSQVAVPPGGHLDFTVNRDPSGGWPAVYPYPAPAGRRSSDVTPHNGQYPFYQHMHRYDTELGDRFVPFIVNGQPHGQREQYTQFYDLIDQLPPNERIYIEFGNVGRHGYSRYELDVQGEPEVYRGEVRSGFPAGIANGSSLHRTRPFRAGDLRTFTLDVRSLRGLQQLFDGQRSGSTTCEYQWPICVGMKWNRNGALIVRVKKANGRRLYEGSLYWHMQEEEYEEHQREEEEWLERIRNGEAFGTALRMGRHAKLRFDLDPIEAIGTRLGFDSDEVIHEGTWASHISTDERGGLIPGGGDGAGDGGGDGGGDGDGGGLVVLCHRSGGNQQTVSLLPALVQGHLLHGDSLGACPSGDDDDDDGDDDDDDD